MPSPLRHVLPCSTNTYFEALTQRMKLLDMLDYCNRIKDATYHFKHGLCVAKHPANASECQTNMRTVTMTALILNMHLLRNNYKHHNAGRKWFSFLLIGSWKVTVDKEVVSTACRGGNISDL